MRTVGIELGSGVARLVVGDQRRGRFVLHEAATIPYRGEGVDAAAAAVAAFLSQQGRQRVQVVVGLPLAQTIVKLVKFPTTNDENLARLVRSTAESALPLPVDQVFHSHAVVSLTDARHEATVALAAGRRDAVNALLQPLAAVGLEPAVVEVSAAALANLFSAHARRGGQPTAILELSDNDVQLVILDGQGCLRLVRTIAADPGEVPEEVRRSFQTYAGGQGEPVTELLVVGPGAADSVSVFAEALSLPVKLGNPWDGNELEASFPDRGASYAVATGLALRGGEVPLRLNLKPVDEAISRRRETSLAGLAVTALAVLLLLGVGLFYQSYRGRQAAAEDAAAALAAVEDQLAQAGGEDPAFLADLEQTATRVRTDTDWLQFLKDLSLRLPGGVALDELNCDLGRPVTLRGQAYSNAAIAATMDVLNELGRFETVRLDYSNAAKIGEELVYNFQITCPWRAKTPGTRKEAG